ncbi:MAG: Arm DNA-binding domain-containing protein [Gallionellaceae bacterium]
MRFYRFLLLHVISRKRTIAMYPIVYPIERKLVFLGTPTKTYEGNMSKLTDIQIRGWIKADERFEMRGDGDGLYLRYRQVDANPLWRFRYRFAGKQRVMNLGSYTSLSLADARKTAKELRARVSLGHDVVAEKHERKRVAVAKIEAEKNALTVGLLTPTEN